MTTNFHFSLNCTFNSPHPVKLQPLYGSAVWGTSLIKAPQKAADSHLLCGLIEANQVWRKRTTNWFCFRKALMLFSILSPLFGLAETFKVTVWEHCKNTLTLSHKKYTNKTFLQDKHKTKQNKTKQKKEYISTKHFQPLHFLSPFFETYIFELLKSGWKSQRCLAQFFWIMHASTNPI